MTDQEQMDAIMEDMLKDRPEIWAGMVDAEKLFAAPDGKLLICGIDGWLTLKDAPRRNPFYPKDTLQ